MLDPEAAGRSPKIKTHLSRKGIAASAHQAAQPRKDRSYGFKAKLDHSHFNAIIGSTFVARRAGIQQATIATQASSAAMAMKVSGSVGLTP